MGSGITYIPLTELIISDLHPHLEFQEDNLDNLTNSIKKMGIIEPIIVRKKEDKYEILIGNRRYNAAKILNLDKIPAIVVDVNDEQAINMIITHSIQKKDLSSKEEANLYEKALSFPNTNIDQIGISLGIPIDRIKSKLKTIKKKTPINNNQIIDIINENKEKAEENNNTINNDIINLNELDNKDIRRERLNMNENQFANGSINNGQPISEEPTFGGRFFPSADEQVTNEGMTNPAMEAVAPNLTMPANEPQPAIEPMPIPNMAQVQQPEANPMPAPEIPNINIPSFNNNIDPIPNPTITATPSSFESVSPIPNPIEENNMNIPQMPAVDSIPNLAQEPSPISNEPKDSPVGNMGNIPEFSVPSSNSPKDVTPIVNIIRSITDNMELLGYKLNITESDTPNSYQISIEVEK